MNPFVLNKMHGAFVPDRLTDIAATTPAVNPEPTVQPRHTHIQSFPKYIDITSYRFDVAHRGDIAMLMEDDGGVQVTCDVVALMATAGVQVTVDSDIGLVAMPASWKSTK